MKYSRLGSTGTYISKIALGTLDFGIHISEEESFKIMDKALDLGINMFDTANVYGQTIGKFGLSESIIGKWFEKNKNKRAGIILNTKCSMKLDDKKYGFNDNDGISAYKIRNQFNDSLERLKTDYSDILTIHFYAEDYNWKEIWDEYERLFNQDKVIYAGASNFSSYAIAKCQQEAEKRNLLGLVSEQNRYNLCCRQVEIEMTSTLKKERISLLTWNPLFGGRLTSKAFNQPKVGRRFNNPLPDKLMIKLEEFFNACEKFDLLGSDVALSWLLHNENVSSILLGVQNAEELEEATKCLDLEIPFELKQKIEDIFPGYSSAPHFYNSMKVNNGW